MHPRVEFSGDKRPSEADIADLHHRAHDQCFIANSVTTKVTVE
jgi:organic hydroperoxide reductase OsmC/OhrA